MKGLIELLNGEKDEDFENKHICDGIDMHGQQAMFNKGFRWTRSFSGSKSSSYIFLSSTFLTILHQHFWRFWLCRELVDQSWTLRKSENCPNTKPYAKICKKIVLYMNLPSFFARNNFLAHFWLIFLVLTTSLMTFLPIFDKNY